MHWFMRLALLAAPLCSTTLAEDTTSPAQQGNSIYGSAQEAFHDLLSVIPEESLQAALTSLTKFKEGVFESHHRGVEHVHNSNPALATKLIVAAVQDLRRRQVNGTTPASTSAAQSSQAAVQSSQAAVQSSQVAVQSSQVAVQSSQAAAQSSRVASQTSGAAPQSTAASAQSSEAAAQSSEATAQSSEAVAQSSGSAAQSSGSVAQSSGSAAQSSAAAAQSSAAPVSSAPLAVILPVQVTTTNSRGSTVVQTTQILSEVTASIAVTVIRTNSQGTTVTEVQTKPAVIVTTTDSAGQTTVTTAAGQLQPTQGEVMTMTDERGSTLLTTYTPGGGKISSVKLITTTDAQGRPSTITSFAFVDATPTIAAGGSGNETPTTQRPGLQSGAAKKNSAFEYAVVGGLGGVLALFV